MVSAPTGDVAPPELLIFVVLPVCVHVPPLTVIGAEEEVPCISFPEPTKKFPRVNVKVANRKLEDVASVPPNLFTSTLANTALTDKLVNPWMPVPEKTILAPGAHEPKQTWPVEYTFILPFTFNMPPATGKEILLLVLPVMFRSLHTALGLSIAIT